MKRLRISCLDASQTASIACFRTFRPASEYTFRCPITAITRCSCYDECGTKRFQCDEIIFLISCAIF